MAKAEYRSAIRSRKLINEALVDLLLEKQLDKITVTDVVKRAEINRGTFYAHYKDIKDVINHWVEEAFSSIRDAIAMSQSSLMDMPHALLTQVQTILEENLDFYRKIMNSSASIFIEEQLVQVVLDYLLEHEMDFAGENYEQYAFKVRFSAGGLSNLYREWSEGHVPMTLDELTIQAEKVIKGIIGTK